VIPYFEQPAWHIGPLTIHAFGVAVAAAVWIGFAIAQRRFDELRLDAQIGQRLGVWMMCGGILGAHLFAVLFYFPHRLQTDPWVILRLWEPISSFGGMLGGIVGALLFFAGHREIDRQTKLAYLDVVAFVFPVSLALGRLGCALAHDHPGTVTSFPLAISLKTAAAREYIADAYASTGLAFPEHASRLGFHDLGLYEFLYLSLVVVPLFVLWRRHRRADGFYLTAFAALYLPVRFALDMLRVSDARYLRLTPAQWVAAVILAVLPFVAMRHRKLRLAISGVVILAAGWACWGGRV
jgi:phosphatidylglycerol---prolipoprotein diacylglyceryl transferase